MCHPNCRAIEAGLDSSPSTPFLPHPARPGARDPPRFPPLTVDHPFSCRTVSVTSGCGVRSTGFVSRDLRFGFADSNPHWVDPVGRYIRCKPDKKPRFSGRRNGQIAKVDPYYRQLCLDRRHRSRREAPPMSLEPGMTASIARARARGAQFGLTTPVPWEKWGGTALVNGDRCATKSPRTLSWIERGTGLDHREGEFSPARPRDHGAELVALSSFALGIYVLLQGVPANHWTAVETDRKMRLFSGSRVPFSSI